MSDIATIISTVPDSGRACIIQVPTNVLAQASDRFRASLHVGFKESHTKTIEIQVDTIEEAKELQQLVWAAQRPGTYCTDTDGVPLNMNALVWRLLVAHKFAFQECIEQCHQQARRIIDNTADLTILNVPEPFHDYPDIAATIEHAIATFCENLGQDYERGGGLLSMERTVLPSLAGVRTASLVQLSPALLDLPPSFFARIIRARRDKTALSDNAFYTTILCYLEQSLACKDMDDEEKLDVYKLLAESLFFPCDMTGDYVGLVVSTCPYLHKSGMFTRVMAAALAPPVSATTPFFPSLTLNFSIRLADLLPFKTHQKQYHTLRMVMGRVLLMCVERRAAADGGEDVFALSLLTICPGTAASHGRGPFAIRAIRVKRPSFSIAINTMAVRSAEPEVLSALVHFEDDPEPTMHEIEPRKAASFSIDQVALHTSHPLWSSVVRPHSPWFHGEEKTMHISLSGYPYK